jgi:periplasmic copper chaperone A
MTGPTKEGPMKRTLPIAAVLLLAAPAAAQAHVTLQPAQAPAGSYSVLDVRVPTEREDASTTKVDVQFPDGVTYAATQPVPGWTARVRMVKLPEPVKQHGEEIAERVDRITWTATGKGVAPGQFQDLPVQMKVPDGQAGTTVTFKALQTYSDGQVVRWIGSPDADRPAPQVTLTKAEDEHGAATAPVTTAAAATPGDGDGTGLAIAALAVGVLGLLTGAAGLVTARRRA